MKRFGLTALVLMLLIWGCQSSRPNLNKQVLEITALYTTDISKLDIAVNKENIELNWSSISPAGEFIRIALPATSHNYQPNWNNTDGFLHLVVPGNGFVDVGIAALNGYSGEPANLILSPNAAGKATSRPPLGTANEVDSIVAYQLEDSVRLEWTEVNVGDYDFNGEVNIADLTPIARNFGERYQTNSPTKKEQTLYWVDGDRNGEVNLTDITPIAINYSSRIDSYKIYNGSVSSTTIEHEAAQDRKKYPEPLPHFYSVLVDGLATDSWAVAPLDDLHTEGAKSTVQPVVIEDFNAEGSLLISGLELYQIDDGTGFSMDSGFSLMRIIDPGEDIDSEEIGEIIEGVGGSFALQNIPLDRNLALEVTFAPIINLQTGEAFSEDPAENEAMSLASPVTVRAVFNIPEGESSFNMEPRINLLQTPEIGYFVDFTVDTSWGIGSVQYTTRLDYYNLRVATKKLSIPDYRIQPRLRDSNRDAISDARMVELSDIVDYGLDLDNKVSTVYKSRVTGFSEPNGTLVMIDPLIVNKSMPGVEFPAPPGVYEFHFTEYTLFKDDKFTQNFYPAAVLGNEVEILVYELVDVTGTLPTKWWADTITRTDLLPEG